MTPTQILVNGKYLIKVSSPRGLGSTRIVRVYRKLLFFRRRISSDWFLDQEQAELFVRKLQGSLSSGANGAA